MINGDGYAIAHRDELEREGGWSLARRTLGCTAFGMNLVEIEPDAQIPEHDETERDQEEVFLVLEGEATLVIEGEDEKLGDAIRIAAEEGMQDFTMSLKELVDNELVNQEAALEIAPNPQQLKMALKGIDIAQSGLL